MRLAVLIPVYNHAHYVARAIESCLAQTRRPDRIICLDDGSKDDSAAVCEGYASQGVEVHRQPNANAYNTINRLVGMAATDCDVVSILNSDDHYRPERFARLLPILEQQPEKQVVCSALHIMDGDDAPLDPALARAKWFRAVWSCAAQPSLDLCEWLGMANFPATTSNIITRTAFLQRFPFRPYHFNHDYYFLAQAILREALVVVPEVLVNYRVHATNTMNVRPAPLLREMLRMHLDLAHDLAPELLTDEGLRTRYARYRRAMWDNVSAFHPGLFETLMAHLIADTSEEQRSAAAQILAEDAREWSTYPNKALVNAWDERGPLSAAQGLAEKYAALKAEHDTLKAEHRAWKETARAWAKASASKSLAWRRLLGLWRAPSPKLGPTEQLAALADHLK
jgi:glycosyltransferase involved in cell wall biosynthesis